MGLSIGILGLPNVGKSTTFNALTKTQLAEAANYPFCTIQPNKAIVSLPDSRLDAIAHIVQPQRVERSRVEFVDIAGLVSGASKGEGLGNQFLSNVRECECLLHMVRCFEDSNITHVHGRIDPKGDCEIIELELILSDLQSVQNRIDRLRRLSKSPSKEAKSNSAQLEVAIELESHLSSGKSAKLFHLRDSEEFAILNRELRLLSNKEMIYVANVDEDSLGGNELTEIVMQHASLSASSAAIICAQLEMDMIDMDDDERDEFLRELQPESRSGLDQVIQISFAKLGLISYFTAGKKEVRSWSIKEGSTAPVAAGVIHQDLQKGFIRAEVISYEDFISHGGEQRAKDAGLMRLEGKEYIVRDGDVIHFRCNA